MKRERVGAGGRQSEVCVVQADGGGPAIRLRLRLRLHDATKHRGRWMDERGRGVLLAGGRGWVGWDGMLEPRT